MAGETTKKPTKKTTATMRTLGAAKIEVLRGVEDQKAYDSQCKFFTSEALSGLVTVFRRILVIHLPSSVIDAFIEDVDTKIKKNKKLSYLELK